MATEFFIPSRNILGKGALDIALQQIADQGFQKALIVTDKPLTQLGFTADISKRLEKLNMQVAVFDDVKPNPTTSNVEDGLKVLQSQECDCVISVGGGSPHDCAKGIAIVATNGGKIEDYEGLDKSAKPQLPLFSINTTAGTASEMTRFTIITDESRHVKMAIVDKHVTPLLSVNDPDMMAKMPASLTAATGMDALTHAVEAYVSTAANPITDACAIKAIELIARFLPTAVHHGDNEEAREQMAYAQFLAGMAFNNASLGYVHAMAHQLGGVYDLPHGVCNALLLPHVQAFNQKAAKERLAHVYEALSNNNDDLKDLEVVSAIQKLASIVGIPKSLRELGVKEEDFDKLATNALKDVCGLTNPIQATHEEIVGIFRSAF